MRRSGLLFSIILLLAGCQQASLKSGAVAGDTPDDLRRQIDVLRQENARQQQQLQEQEKQLAALRGFAPDRLNYLVHVERIEFGRFSRGYDDNKDGIDDGLNLYLALADAQGDTIKAAGDVAIEVWDLAAPAQEQRLGHWLFPAQELAQYWLGGPMANHYRFKLAWPHGSLPQHRNLTVKLTFTDALTGQTFEIQQMFTVALAPSSS